MAVNGCKAFIKLAVDPNLNVLRVTSANLEHNHEPGLHDGDSAKLRNSSLIGR